ncbi:hypothetical protein QV12_06415 [Pseudomonas putida]|nr:hypothetical protein QV12_06415 [Pseudomonas putida]
MRGSQQPLQCFYKLRHCRFISWSKTQKLIYFPAQARAGQRVPSRVGLNLQKCAYYLQIFTDTTHLPSLVAGDLRMINTHRSAQFNKRQVLI